VVDEPAVADAFRKYAPAVYGRCAQLLADRDAARDVTQEVFVRCVRERRGLRPGRELLAWLYRVATNLCLNHLRASRLRQVDPLSEDLPGAPAPDPDRRLVLRALSGLDERTQAVAIYVLVDGMTQAEAAEVAGVTDRTVRNCLTRFREHARAVLGRDPVLPDAPPRDQTDGKQGKEEQHGCDRLSVRLQSGRP
jgi:RNA polymerase sigma-70 factor, ECF subfamily